MNKVAIGEFGILVDPAYIQTLVTVEQLDQELDKVAVGDFEAAKREAEDDNVVDPATYMDYLKSCKDALQVYEHPIVEEETDEVTPIEDEVDIGNEPVDDEIGVEDDNQSAVQVKESSVPILNSDELSHMESKLVRYEDAVRGLLARARAAEKQIPNYVQALELSDDVDALAQFHKHIETLFTGFGPRAGVQTALMARGLFGDEVAEELVAKFVPGFDYAKFVESFRSLKS